MNVSNIKENAGCLLVLLCSVLLRWNFGVGVQPHGDEIGTFFWTEHSYKELFSSYAKPFLTMHWYIIFVKATWDFFQTAAAYKIINILVSVVGKYIFYRLLRLRFSKSLSLLGLFLVCLNPWLIMKDSLIRVYPISTCVVLMGMYYFYLALVYKRKHSWFTAGILFGACVALSLPSILFFVALTPCLFYLIYELNQKSTSKLEPLFIATKIIVLAILVAILLQIPFIEAVWNWLNSDNKFFGGTNSWTDGVGNALVTPGLWFRGQLLLIAVLLGMLLFRPAVILLVISIIGIFLIEIVVLKIRIPPCAFARGFSYFIFLFIFFAVEAARIVIEYLQPLIARVTKRKLAEISVIGVVAIFCVIGLEQRYPAERRYHSYDAIRALEQLEFEVSGMETDVLVIADYNIHHWLHFNAPEVLRSRIMGTLRGPSMRHIFKDDFYARELYVLSYQCWDQQTLAYSRMCLFRFHGVDKLGMFRQFQSFLNTHPRVNGSRFVTHNKGYPRFVSLLDSYVSAHTDK